MDPSAAQWLFAGLMAIGFVTWICAGQFLIWAGRTRNPKSQPDEGFLLESEAPSGNELSGKVEVQGEPSALSAKAAAWLGTAGMPGLIKIVACDEHQLVFEQAGPGLGAQAGWGIKRGTLQFERAGSDRTMIHYHGQLSTPRWLLWMGGVFWGVGGFVLIVGGILLWNFVVTSPNPGLRWQTFQTVQTYHLLWPPFLLGGLYRSLRNRAGAQLESLAHNLPYVDTSAANSLRIPPTFAR